ncbi:hypothetical protein BKA69DRAFT_333164 [Paraphysoderma sedebokerense]|nr:hypothetical protein BKA69DRAFT_333164 [Paraphysoderma sedebokerense]
MAEVRNQIEPSKAIANPTVKVDEVRNEENPSVEVVQEVKKDITEGDVKDKAQGVSIPSTVSATQDVQPAAALPTPDQPTASCNVSQSQSQQSFYSASEASEMDRSISQQDISTDRNNGPLRSSPSQQKMNTTISHNSFSRSQSHPNVQAPSAGLSRTNSVHQTMGSPSTSKREVASLAFDKGFKSAGKNLSSSMTNLNSSFVNSVHKMFENGGSNNSGTTAKTTQDAVSKTSDVKGSSPNSKGNSRVGSRRASESPAKKSPSSRSLLADDHNGQQASDDKNGAILTDEGEVYDVTTLRSRFSMIVKDPPPPVVNKQYREDLTTSKVLSKNHVSSLKSKFEQPATQATPPPPPAAAAVRANSIKGSKSPAASTNRRANTEVINDKSSRTDSPQKKIGSTETDSSDFQRVRYALHSSKLIRSNEYTFSSHL